MYQSSQAPTNPRWIRSKDGIVAGVCAGLARQFSAEPWLVRFIWVMMVLFFGTGLLLYIIFAICLPREDRLERADKRMLLGVCARIGRRGDMETGIARLCAVALLVFTGGTAVVGYVVLYFLMPDAPSLPSRSSAAN